MPLGEYTEVCRGAKGGEVVYTQLIPWWPQLRRNYAVFTESFLLQADRLPHSHSYTSNKSKSLTFSSRLTNMIFCLDINTNTLLLFFF